MVRKEKEKIDEIVQCPECGSRHLIKDYSRAELVCEDCGLVIDQDFIDHGPEWRAFDSEQREKKARTGAPMNYMIHDKGLSTTDIGTKLTRPDSHSKNIVQKSN